jgi:hypothetical protein
VLEFSSNFFERFNRLCGPGLNSIFGEDNLIFFDLVGYKRLLDRPGFYGLKVWLPNMLARGDFSCGY